MGEEGRLGLQGWRRCRETGSVGRSSEPGARERPTSGTRSSGASGPSRWFGGRGRGRRSATREGAGRPCFVMEDVQLLVLLRLFSKRPSYRNSASGIEEDHHDCFFFHAIVQNWVRMNNATEVMLIPRILYVLLSPGDYFEWLCEFSTLCNSRCKGPRFLVVTLQPHWAFCRWSNNAKDGAACHVLGHTHFCWDYAGDNIRYVQAPLAYPRERKRRINGGQGWLPFFVYCDGFNPETRIEGSLRTLSLRHGSSNFLFIRLLFDKMFPDVRTGHTFARLDVFLLMHFIASCYMLCLLCFVAYHLFLFGEIMIHASIVVSNLHKNAKKSFSETIKDMYLHYNERSGLLLCGFQI
ncbi:hypothetical protein VPH35_095857 [Triticum aestivum]